MSAKEKHTTSYELNSVSVTSLEKMRADLNGALATVYRTIAYRELGDEDVLSLGIGTGLVEAMSGLKPEKVIGVDISSAFLQKAAERLPGARLYHGCLPDILSQIPAVPVAFTSDCLNCLDPKTYPDIFRLLKERTKKVVIVNTRLPLGDFFEAVKAPGIRSFSPQQQESAQRHLIESGLANPAIDPKEWIQGIQNNIEKRLGQPFRIPYLELLRRLEFLPLNEVSKKFEKEALPTQVLALLESLEANTGITDVFNPDYIRPLLAHTTYEMTHLFRVSLATEYCHILLTDAALQAGYKNVQRKPISAVGNKIVQAREVMEGINKALKLFEAGLLTKDEANSSLLNITVNGANLRFRSKELESFDGIYTEYLTITNK